MRSTNTTRKHYVSPVTDLRVTGMTTSMLTGSITETNHEDMSEGSFGAKGWSIFDEQLEEDWLYYKEHADTADTLAGVVFRLDI